MDGYKQALTDAMTALGKEPETVFIGYNVGIGKAAGSMNGVPEEKLIEMPLAENLMTGVAIGMALDGHIPILYFERMDFILIALDAIVNHLDKLSKLSEGIHKPAVIIRVVVGNSKTPLFTGSTHCQNFREALKAMVSFPVIQFWDVDEIPVLYSAALIAARQGKSTLLIEQKDEY